jgi:hypothetical protein
MVQRWVEKKDYEPEEVVAAVAAAGWHFVSVYLQNSFLSLGPLLLDLRIPGSLELDFLSTNSNQNLNQKKNQLDLKSTSHKPLTPTSLSFANLLTLLGATQI